MTDNISPENDAEFFRKLVETARDIITVSESDGTVRYVSPAVKEILGPDPEELTGTFLLDYVHPDDVERLTAELSSLVSRPGAVKSVDYRGLRTDGNIIFMEGQGVNLLDDPVVSGIVVISRDVTDRKLAVDGFRELREAFDTVTETIDSPMFSLDGGYRYTSFNPAHAQAMKALYGTDIELGSSILDCMTVPGDREKAMLNLDRALAGERVEEESFSGDGNLSRAYFTILHNPIRDADGRVIGVAVSARDLTERRRVEEALRESEEKYRTLFENMLEGASLCRMIYDHEGRPVDWVYLEVNKMFGPLTGLWNVEGKRVTEIIPGIRRDNPELFEYYGRVADTGVPMQFDVRLEQLGIELSYKVFSPETGYFVSVFENITELKLSERRLREMNAELDGFAHTVSHDLKGPLSAIGIATDLLTELLGEVTISPEQRADFEHTLAITRMNVERAVRLTGDLLVLAEAGNEPAEVEQVDIGGIVRRIIADKALLVDEKGASFDLDDNLGSVAANPTHMYQLFGNLLDNAMRHGSGDSAKIAIHRLEREGAGAHGYLVRDNGPGIPDSDPDLVFLPFHKGDESGTGIGLATVSRIVELYGGRIRAYNDGGACFEFTLFDARRENGGR